jgi:ABC-type lipoprotein export system ATPase subunit
MTVEPGNEMICCEELYKIYKTKETEVVALQGLDLEVEKGEMLGIIGNSGSGKSTLLNMLGGLDRPTAGSLIIDGKNMLRLSERQMVQYKLDTVGFVWQNNARNLIPYLTSVENVEFPMMIAGRKEKRKRALELLDMVGMSNRKYSKLAQLSGGEQQRIAISIALANNPKLLLADEPTGSVDTKTGDIIFDIFKELNRMNGITIVIVTHDRMLSKKVERVVAIRDGRTSSEYLQKTYSEELAALAKMDKTKLEDTHVELAVLDKAGRLQIPMEYLNNLGVTNKQKVVVGFEDGRIVITNPQNK